MESPRRTSALLSSLFGILLAGAGGAGCRPVAVPPDAAEEPPDLAGPRRDLYRMFDFTRSPDGEADRDGAPPDPGDLGPVRECDDDRQCKAPTPYCDRLGRCVVCASDEHCGDGMICRQTDCRPGCGSGKGCGDAGWCDEDGGQCRSCMADRDCAGATPRCEVASGRCVACLPMNDNCPQGKLCVAANGAWGCAKGCKLDPDCGPGSGCCNGLCADLMGDVKSCGACGRACAQGQSCCGGACLDTERDLKNCGGCGLACSPANATPDCAGGQCVVAKCKDGFADCDGAPGSGCEVELARDPAHCTGCGKACTAAHGKAGCDGKCNIVACDPGFADCNQAILDGCEVSLGADVAHCGGCGMACGKVARAQVSCAMGRCLIAACEPGFADCDQSYANGCEIDVANDVNSCGQCARVCAPLANASAKCSAGACALGVCAAPFRDCNQDAKDGCEVDSQHDEKHCGDCGKPCAAVTNGVALCDGGACLVGSCGGAFADCNKSYADGCESDLNAEIKNCGACGRACAAVANGAPGCNNGSCGVGACNAPFADCNRDPGDGCEASLDSNIKSCGGCGMVCPAVTNATPGCAAGKCGIGACSGAFRDCDKDLKTGCEVDTSTDVLHCGACGNKCPVPPNGAASCIAGQCGVASCGAPFRDCNMNPQDGCETNTDSSEKHCGACNSACGAIANGTPGCKGGGCGIGSCSAPFGDCRNGAVDGCETNTATDVQHCGGCGQKCAAVANGLPGCASGQCGIASCNAPFKDCRNGAADGCEANTQSDLKHCGGCDKVCPVVAHGAPACRNGLCEATSCAAPWRDCNRLVGDGCEIDTDGDPAHCGDCLTACTVAHGAPLCERGECAIASCDAPFRDCSNGYADGCETNSSSSVSHCGACGNKCSVAGGVAACLDGACAIASCTAPWKDCKNGYGDGCESDSGSDVSHCGACGNKCAVANGAPACIAGSCAVASCAAGFGNCDKQYANGCEVDLRSDAKNCGGCGAVCPSGVCTGGACFYAPKGPQLDVPVAQLNGWKECYRGGYDQVLPVQQIKNQCTKAKLMLGCRILNATKLNLLAWAPRNDVFFNTGDGNTTHEANSASWYFSDNYSWGFAVEGDAVFRNQCDVLNQNPAYRMCWHTLPDLGGWRCGIAVNLNEAWVWERMVFQAD